MNRRGFLKLCGVVAGSMCLPATPGKVKTAACAIMQSGRLYDPHGVAMRALAKWLAERIEDDIIAALSGLQEAA